jgi:sugar-specific transcriptional regulator TrmB
MSDSDAVKVLADLGFNQLEAEVYALLLQESPATGYRIAQLLVKPAAGIYKALESLAKQGAIELDDGETRRCRAVPSLELLAQLERRFTERKKRAEAVLSTIPHAGMDDRIYQLQTPEQVFQRAREMLSRCERITVLGVYPGALEILRSDIEEAARGGTQIVVHSYAETTLNGVEVIKARTRRSSLARWPGEWLDMAVDARELLQAFLSSDGQSVHQAVWSNSRYLAWMAHFGITAAMTGSHLAEHIHAGASSKELEAVLESCERFMVRDAPGYHELLERFGLTK